MNMRFASLLLVASYCLAPAAIALVVPSSLHSTSSCYTVSGASALGGSIPTVVRSKTVTITTTVTSAHIQLGAVTPATVTIVAPTSTYVIGVDSFANDIVTIPTSPGFLPVASTLPQGVFQQRDKVPLAALAAPKHSFSINLAGSRPSGNAQKVICSVVLSKVVTTTVFTTANAGKVQAATTATIHPKVTVTDELAAQSTFYAACANNNMIDQVESGGFLYPVNGFGYASAGFTNTAGSTPITYTSQPADSPYECCVAAQQIEDSTAFFYTGWDYGSKSDSCIIFMSSTCPIPASQAQVYGVSYNGTTSQIGQNYRNFMGNANCGNGVTAASNYTIITQAQSGGSEGGGISGQSGAGVQVG